MTYPEIIQSKLVDLGWSIKKFADEIGRSPEHARKIKNGTAFPSGDLSEKIAATLDLDIHKFREQVEVAKWQRAHDGRKPPVSERTDLGHFERLWAALNEEQRGYVTCMARCILVSKRKRPSTLVQ